MNFNLIFQTAMVFSTGLFSFFILSFELTSLAGKSLYLIWVCCLFLSFSGNFSLLPTATAKAFGKTHYGVNYGMVFTASVSYTIEFTNKSIHLLIYIQKINSEKKCKGVNILGLGEFCWHFSDYKNLLLKRNTCIYPCFCSLSVKPNQWKPNFKL